MPSGNTWSNWNAVGASRRVGVFIIISGARISNSKWVNRSCSFIFGFLACEWWGGVSPLLWWLITFPTWHFSLLDISHHSHQWWLSPAPPASPVLAWNMKPFVEGKKIPGFFFHCPNFLTNLVEIFCEGFILINNLILQMSFLQMSQPS